VVLGKAFVVESQLELEPEFEWESVQEESGRWGLEEVNMGSDQEEETLEG
jgi:hypothetical protein